MSGDQNGIAAASVPGSARVAPLDKIVQPQRHHPGLGGGVDELSAIRGQRQSKWVLGPCAGDEVARSDPRASKRLSWGNRRRRPFTPVTNGGNREDHGGDTARRW